MISIDIFRLCLLMDSGGRRVQWLWTQLVHCMACIVDSALLERARPDEDAQAVQPPVNAGFVEAEAMLEGRVEGQRARRLAKVQGKFAVRTLVPATEAQRVMQYYFSEREAF
eukprot:3817910-Heterocapsa_arctica.AAC.1